MFKTDFSLDIKLLEVAKDLAQIGYISELIVQGTGAIPAAKNIR